MARAAGDKRLALYKSETGGNTPAAADLLRGELAVNLADKKLFTKDQSDAVVTLSEPDLYLGQFASTLSMAVAEASGKTAATPVPGEWFIAVQVNATTSLIERSQMWVYSGLPAGSGYRWEKTWDSDEFWINKVGTGTFDEMQANDQALVWLIHEPDDVGGESAAEKTERLARVGVYWKNGINVWQKLDESSQPILDLANDLATNDATKALTAAMGVAIDTRLDALEGAGSLGLINDLTTNDGTKALSAAMGFNLNTRLLLLEAIDHVVVANNLTTNDGAQALSAAMGFALDGRLQAAEATLVSNDTALDTVQEIVNYIKNNRSDIDTLLALTDLTDETLNRTFTGRITQTGQVTATAGTFDWGGPNVQYTTLTSNTASLAMTGTVQANTMYLFSVIPAGFTLGAVPWTAATEVTYAQPADLNQRFFLSVWVNESSVPYLLSVS